MGKIYLINHSLLSSSASFSILNDIFKSLIDDKGIILYCEFISLIENNKVEIDERELINNINFDSSSYLFSRRSLEALNLISTYKDGENYLILINEISLDNIFNNNLFINLLIGSVGEEKYNKLRNKYYKDFEVDNYEKINAKFNDVFNIGIDSKKIIIEKKEGVFNGVFEIKKLKTYINKNSNISLSAISENEYRKIEEIANFYGLDENSIGDLVISSFDYSKEMGKHIDFEYFNKEIKKQLSYIKIFNNKEKININSETELAKLVNKYENTAPIQFLKEKQGGVEPVRADINLVEYLYNNIGLSNGVINCLIDYILKNKDGELNKAYVEKIAATIKRKNISNSLDCYNYLYKKNGNIGKIENKSVENSLKIKEENEEDNEDVILTEEDLKRIFGD